MIVYLSLEEFAERVSLSYSTLRGYELRDRERGQWHLLPAPDAVIGETGSRPRYGWLGETCDAWDTSGRLGQGARTDLRSNKPPGHVW